MGWGVIAARFVGELQVYRDASARAFHNLGPAAGRDLQRNPLKSVTPAKAGVQGRTVMRLPLDSRLRGNDDWIPIWLVAPDSAVTANGDSPASRLGLG